MFKTGESIGSRGIFWQKCFTKHGNMNEIRDRLIVSGVDKKKQGSTQADNNSAIVAT